LPNCVIVVLVLIVGGLLFNKYLDHSATEGQARFDALSAQVAQDKQIVAQMAAQSAADQVRYQQMLETLQRQNAALAATIASDNALLKRLQEKDELLPLPDLGTRWTQLVPLQPADLSVVNNQITISESGARATVIELERVPILTDQLQKQEQIANNNQTLLTQAQTVINSQGKQITGLNTLVTDSDKKCQAQVAMVKDDTRKSKRNWFIAGNVIGFIVRQVIKTYTGM